jgi:uncharacterized membrane protein
MVEVTLYMRGDCHLCEVAQEYLKELETVIPHHLTIIDIDSDIKLRNLYGFNVPVILVGPYKLSAPIEKKDLEISLMAVHHSQKQEEKIEKAIIDGKLLVPVTWTKSDNFTYWLSKHYLAIFNILVFIYVGLPFLAPTMMKVGADGPADIIYRAYGFVCHQLAYRSWFLFGEQIAYPRVEANTDFVSYQQATGLDGNDLFSAREFVGNEQIGYKVALCQRDVAIYGGILMFGLIFAISKRRNKSLHWLIWILIGVVPIAVDGLSQLISQLPLGAIPFRESTPLLRTVTGFLFGFMTAWFGYPYVEESMSENRKYMEGKLSQAKKSPASKSF